MGPLPPCLYQLLVDVYLAMADMHRTTGWVCLLLPKSKAPALHSSLAVSSFNCSIESPYLSNSSATFSAACNASCSVHPLAVVLFWSDCSCFILERLKFLNQ